MKNADKFKLVFGLYATELWSMSEEDFLKWLNSESIETEQPEIIRCKDCKYRYVDGDNVRFNVCKLNHNKVQSDDWYCADVERIING